MSFESDLQQFMAAIRQRESGGNYQIVGTDHGSRYGVARGAYQIMSGIWDGWAKEAGIPGADWRDPAAQDNVAKYKMTRYFQKYGDWRLVAAAWFGGEGAANELARTGSSRRADGFGTTVDKYVSDVTGLMGSTSSPAQSADRAMMNSAIASSPVSEELSSPFEPPSREEMREQVTSLLDAMSRRIASSPDRFASLYGREAEETDDDEIITAPRFDEEAEDANAPA